MGPIAFPGLWRNLPTGIGTGTGLPVPVPFTLYLYARRPPPTYTGTRHHPRYIRASASARRRAGMPQTSPPVCVWNGATWSREGHLYTMFDYSGKRHFRVEQGTEVLSNATAVWHESAVLSWLSCEQNLNHFVGETLGPAHRAAAANTNRTSDPHLIITSPAMWPHPHPDGCVGHRFLWLLSLMPTQPDVFLARSHAGDEEARHESSPYFLARMPPSRVFSTVTNASQELSVPHCFRRVVVASPIHSTHGPGRSAIPASFYRDLGARAAQRGFCDRGRGYTLLVQRAASRRIVNEAAVVEALRQTFKLAVVVAVLEQRVVPEQMALACGARVFVGTHGMGMEWAHFVNGARGSGLVIELAWEGWPCYYTHRAKGTGKLAICLNATPTTRPPTATGLRLQERRAGKDWAKHVNVSLETRQIDQIAPRWAAYQQRRTGKRSVWRR